MSTATATSAAAALVSGPTATTSSLSHFRRAGRRGGCCGINSPSSSSGRITWRPSLNRLFFFRRSYSFSPASQTRKNDASGTAAAPFGPFSPVMEWQDCSSEIEVDVPCSVAYDCYSDRELIPQWMPFIASVKVVKDKPDLSRWSLKYEVFGRDVEFSWLARNLQPIRNQKIHWRSLEGLPNRGAVRFYPKGPSSCRIVLTVSYEVPQILIPVASALKPFLEGLLLRGLEQFAIVAKSYQSRVP